jgi:precorrin-3B C17-methyltransferase
MKGKISVIGIGPGDEGSMSFNAVESIKKSDVVIGYVTYMKLIGKFCSGKTIESSGMRHESERCRKAVLHALEGRNVAVISSGDPGVYGMAGLLIQMVGEIGADVDMEVIPGISALNSCAAVLGAPLMNDFAVISLSDHLTKWEDIRKRIRSAAEVDFVICLYNPRSSERPHQIVEAKEIISASRPESTPVGIVTDCGREREAKSITTLGDMLNYDIGMTTTVIIGNSKTCIVGGRMVTSRGYVI